MQKAPTIILIILFLIKVESIVIPATIQKVLKEWVRGFTTGNVRKNIESNKTSQSKNFSSFIILSFNIYLLKLIYCLVIAITEGPGAKMI